MFNYINVENKTKTYRIDTGSKGQNLDSLRRSRSATLHS